MAPIPLSTSPACPCCNTSTVTTESTNYIKSETTDPPLVITTSDFNIHVKEIIILSLIFLLLVYAVVTFLNNWSKNYRDLNQAPFYSHAEAEDDLSGVLPPLPWEEEEDFNMTGSRISKLSTVVRAMSVMERTQGANSSYSSRPPSRMSRPRKSLSASTLFPKSRPPKLVSTKKPQSFVPENKKYFSFEKEFSSQNCSFDCHLLTPRISIDETDSLSPPPSFHRHYLKYQARSQGGTMYSSESHTSKEELISQDVGSQQSKSNLQICQLSLRDDGGSFSFSDLDPVQEDLETVDDLEPDTKDTATKDTKDTATLYP